MTIYDISELAGVSIATVSRVLNGSSNVKEKTKKKVLDVIEQNGYTPNVFARGLGLNTMHTVGILCADCSDIYLAKAVYYIEQHLRLGGYHTILGCTGYELESKKSTLARLLEQRIDSVIMVGSHFIDIKDKENGYVREAAKKVPIMLLNAELDCAGVYSTICDDYKATRDATMFFLNKGVQDILYLYNSHSYSGHKKLSGFQDAMLSMGLTVNPDYIQFFSGSREDIEGVSVFLDGLKEQGLNFHAIVAAEDVLGVGAIKFAKKHALSVPDDLMIMGYNNSLLCTCCEPELSSVDNRLETLCNQLVKTCIGVMNKEEFPGKSIFNAKIVERASTK